jgi:hypothetical protein
VYGRLGISENKAMKLPISAFFILLLLGFAGSSYGQVTAANWYVYVGEFKDTSYLSIRGGIQLWRA